jgi:hypothetical protein
MGRGLHERITPHPVATARLAQGASNELAKRELTWHPEYASWREGFRTALG